MHKPRPKQQLIQPVNNPYELHRALPNPLFAGAPVRQSRMRQPIPIQEEQPKTHNVRKTLVSLLIFAIVVLIGYGGWVGFKAVDNAVHVFGWGGLFSLFWPSRLKGEDAGRVNILLTGYSVDDPKNTGGQLTDSIMLISINTRAHTAYLLSVPRDLYVNIPGNGYAKINEAYEDGQRENFSQPGYPNGGMGLLEEVVSQKLGVTIDYYALLDNNAVKQAVDAVGGITVSIQSPDPRGIYDSYTGLNIPNGMDTLTGQQALELARARCDAGAGDICYGLPNSDFDRTRHQREMLVALESKATTLGVVTNPIRMGELFDAMGKNVTTDLSLGNVRRLYGFLKSTPTSAIQSASMNAANYSGQQNVDLLTGYLTPSGEDALIPVAGVNDFSQIDDYVQQLNNR
jgi:polyisoprenyl-teichoic acid--peptidoglycan teichoic acid transferase